MIEYFDEENNRLVYIGRPANGLFWDSLWESENFARHIKTARHRFIVSNTREYVKKGSKILEGGCGRADKVYALRANGYDAYGVDYAEETVKKVNHWAPDLKVYLGDVRNLQFEDNFFDGYWSLGVIEHYYHGCEEIIREMYRVIRKDGFLFIVVPTMSWLRNFKAQKGMYPKYTECVESIDNFYQFALDPQDVIARFEKHGFKLIKHKYLNTIKGLKDEISCIQKPLQILYDSSLLPARVVRKAIGSVVKYFAAHASFYVFKKK